MTVALRDQQPDDAQHRAALLESSMHKVLDERERGANSSAEALEGGYGKAWFRVTGRRLLIAVLIVLAVTAPTYLLWRHDLESQKMLVDIHGAIKESNDIAQAQLWLMTIPDAERQQMHLARPKKIMEMQR